MWFLRFKEPEDEEEWTRADPRLVHVVSWCSWYMLRHWGFMELVITSFYRDGDRGPHGDYRAADLRIRDWPDTAAHQLTILANQKFANNIQPTAVYGNVDPKGKHWDHIHLQVPKLRRPDHESNDPRVDARECRRV